ncbi:MAG: lipopolysaccharide heptosyltransferase II [Candidatus Omnitrophica bacterium]|nr:lipopolysaccharide heptosyltransferase II [Candidatus Omnitrophota bacterium]
MRNKRLGRTPIHAKRILIWEQNWLGDVIFSTPFIKALRKNFKDAYIACIVNPSSSEVLSGNPHINEIILYDENREHRGIFGKNKLIKRLKQGNFDTVFLLHRSLSRAIICALSGIKRRVGYHYSKRNFMLTEIVDLPKVPLHKIEYFLNIAGRLGMDIQDKKPEFFISKEDQDYAARLLSQNGIAKNDPFIVINTGGNWPPKRWPEKNFAVLSDRFIKEYGIKIVVTGADKDFDRVLHIQEMAHQKLIIICGKTNLKQLAAVFEKARAVISGDSGPMHIAFSIGAKVIALFGPTSPALTGPYGGGEFEVVRKEIGCKIPCYNSGCKDNRCMKAVSVDDVEEAVGKIL